MNKIKELRECKNLSQKEIATTIKTSQSNITRWENEESEPTSSNIIKLANYFQVTTDYLLGRTNDIGIIEIKNKLQPNEEEALSLFRKLSDRNKNKALGFMYALSNS